ncbi:MAG: DNA polymerase III subunit alpha [Planctomycetes bacterium]|nr:DNA polymerase III subunit alpha [Planctomycetota bacterium]
MIPLHVQSHYSLRGGTASVARLVERASALGLPALALTDEENLYGQVIFHRAARQRGIRPVTGVELRGTPASLAPPLPRDPRDPRHPGSAPAARALEAARSRRDRREPPAERVVLLARSREGYENLCRILTRRRCRGVEDPVESVRGLAGGLFLLTDSTALLERLISAAEEHGSPERSSLRLLLVRPAPDQPEASIIEASRRLEIPLVADLDIALLDPEDYDLHRLRAAIHENALFSEVERRRLVKSRERCFRSIRDAHRIFRDVPGAVRETYRVSEACDLDLLRQRPIFPAISLPPGESAYSRLMDLCLRGIRERYGRASQKVLERLTMELGIIEKLGFCEYFIAVGEIVRFARERSIEVVGRGSGAGSLVTFLLGITNVDPLAHRLYFERFLHPRRSDLPDIDIDLCWIRRDEVIRHVYEAYGEDRVAMISSHVTFQPRSALQETLKAFGIPPREAVRHSRCLPHLHGEIASSAPLRELIQGSPHRRSLPLDEMPFSTALPLADRLLHLPHHLSVHPGGIVIADRPIDGYVPLEPAAKGIIVTQYDKDSIEEIGLVKIDLLGSRCLTELQETLEWIENDGARLTLRDIPDEDPMTLDLLAEGRTVGCFQLESPAMRHLLRKMRPRRMRDCIAAVALIRPGAAAAGAKDAYIRRVHGEEPEAYDHPSLRPILEETRGTVIYEEDVMCIASAIAGIDLAAGDLLRSAIKKSRHDDELAELENDFLRRAIHNGVEPHAARRVWNDLRRFASYCFSKAHASGYGVLAYQSAYLKAHHPAAFACALLNNHAGMYSTRTIAEEVRRMGVSILPPCINRSDSRFILEAQPDGRTAVRTALARIKGLSSASQEAIVRERPFRSLLDLIRRTSIPRREVEALILSGAMDSLPPSGSGLDRPRPNHPQLLWELESTYAKERGRGSLGFLSDEACRLDYPPLEDDPPLRRLQNELRTLEMTLSGHPVAPLREDLRRIGAIRCAEALDRIGQPVRVAGILAAVRRVRTSHGQFMQFVTIEDETDLLEATLFPRVYERHARILRGLGPYVFEGTIEEDHRAVSLRVERVMAKIPRIRSPAMRSPAEIQQASIEPSQLPSHRSSR